MSDWLHGVEVPPMTIDEIQQRAVALRRRLQLGHVERFPVLPFLELTMPTLVDHFDLEIVDMLGDRDEARTFPDGTPQHPEGPVIQVLASVYEAAYFAQGRARMTLLHECGHVLLHANTAAYRRGRSGSMPKAWANSEWQANQFAGELLMPVESFASGLRLEEYISLMAVSRQAALVRGAQLIRTKKIASLPWPFVPRHGQSIEQGGTAMQSP